MAGLAVTKDSNGNGSTPLDIRLTNRALYGAGGVVEEHPLELSATDLVVTVPEQIALCSRSAAYGSVWVHVPRTAVQIKANAGVAVFWVEQHDVAAGDADSKAEVGVSYMPYTGSGSYSLPAGRTMLGALMTPPAGSTRATAAVPTGDKTFVVSSGGTLGVLHQWTDRANGLANQNGLDLGRGRVYLPSDRWLRVEMLICVSTDAVGKTGSMRVELNMTGTTSQDSILRHEIEYDGYWKTTYVCSPPLWALAGDHEFWYHRYKQAGDDFYHHYGDIDGGRYCGTVFTVTDLGGAR